jgi:hypothetical protein
VPCIVASLIALPGACMPMIPALPMRSCTEVAIGAVSVDLQAESINDARRTSSDGERSSASRARP